MNYVCHLFVMEEGLLRSIAEKDEAGNVVYERKQYDGAQDYDLILRAAEKAQEIEKEEIAQHGLSKEDQKLLSEARFTSSNIFHI